MPSKPTLLSTPVTDKHTVFREAMSFRVAASAMQGWRRKMEDTLVASIVTNAGGSRQRPSSSSTCSSTRAPPITATTSSTPPPTHYSHFSPNSTQYCSGGTSGSSPTPSNSDASTETGVFAVFDG
eukprot:PhM_4_TR13444/c0_g1_i1/m.103821